MKSGAITFDFDIRACHYLNKNSNYIRAAADANGHIDIASAALQFYRSEAQHEIELQNEEEVNRFKHVARRFFSEFSEN